MSVYLLCMIPPMVKFHSSIENAVNWDVKNSIREYR